MESETKTEKKKIILPKSVIERYHQYRNPYNLKKTNILGVVFEIDQRYEILDSIGKGSYGIVVAAKDNLGPPNRKLVAIKKIEKAFEHRLYAKRTLRELRILRLMQHENVSSIINILLPLSREDFEDIYVVTDLMETDLFSIIRSNQTLSHEHNQFFLYQILRGLLYLHDAHILHRDLKTRNLLINSNSDLKICDFGLSRALIPGIAHSAQIMTNYVATRWYRAPELLFENEEYDYAIDVWSVGCIFAEILLRKPFLPGSDTKNQVELIINFLGTPSEEEIQKIPNKSIRKLIKKLPIMPPKNLEKLFPNVSPLALDLLKKMLILDPKKRIKIKDALEHPYLEDLHDPNDELTTKAVSLIDFEFENYEWKLEQLKGLHFLIKILKRDLDMIYEEILIFHFDQFKKTYEENKKKGKSIIKHIMEGETAKLITNESDKDDYSEEG